MEIKSPGNTSWVLPQSQGFQKSIICGGIMTESPSRHPKSSKNPVFGHSWPSWSSYWRPKVLETVPKYSHSPKVYKKISYVGEQWQNTHQDTQNPPKPQFLDIPDPPDHPNGNQKSWTHFLSTPTVPRIPKSIICGGTMTKSPSIHPKSPKTPVFGHSWPS